MHEVSVMAQLIDEILKVAKSNDACVIISASLEVGELTLLGTRQLKFAYEILSQADETGLLKKSKLYIRRKKGRIRCAACGFKGDIRNMGGINHIFPIFACPDCGGKVDIISGRECLLKSIRLQKNDAKKKKRRK
jgi:hydrogenase nickel incorporation protein HypA/HybF